ncbi:MAG TPA: hypothetical protein VMQ44_03855 [Candidatus Saccharimonadales bacterium]|nr:hypothetical protein [Candidatus Saccharimonadales bacterium]
MRLAIAPNEPFDDSCSRRPPNDKGDKPKDCRQEDSVFDIQVRHDFPYLSSSLSVYFSP